PQAPHWLVDSLLFLLFVGIAEVAVAGPLHNGLGARKLQTRVVALAKGAVTLARQQMANVAQPHFFVHLGVAAAYDVKSVRGIRLFAYLNFQGIFGLP